MPKKGTGSIYYVYALIDQRDGKPFYIGKGKGDRCEHHVKEWKRGNSGGNRAKLERIGEILTAGYAVKISILAQDLLEETAYNLESRYIDELRDTLTNSHSGANKLGAALDLLLSNIARFHKPRAWKLSFLQHHGRLPSDADWDQFVLIYEQHLALRDAMREELAKLDAKKAAA